MPTASPTSQPWRGRFGPPPALLAAVQWMLLGLALVGLALAAVIIGVFSGADPRARACALVAIGWLAWWLASGYREGRFPFWKDLLALVALFVAGVGAGNWEGSLAVLSAAVYLRAFYATPKGSIAVVVGFITVNISALVVVADHDHATVSLEHAVVGSLALAMAAAVVQVMRTAVARRQLAQRRERSLRQAAIELVAAGTPTAVYRAVRRMAAELVGDAGRVQVSLAMLDGPKLRVISTDRSADGATRETRVEASSLSMEGVEAMLGVRPLDGNPSTELDLRRTLRLAPELPQLQVIPLLSEGQPSGGFAIATAERLQRDQQEVMEIVADECSLALSRAALSEDLRGREGRFRSLVQNSSDLVLAIGDNQEFTYVSPSVEALLGGKRRSQRPLSLATLVHPDDLERVLAALEETRQQRGHVRAVECRVVHHDGSWRSIDAYLTNLLHDPYVRAVVINGRDITERRALEDQLRHQALHDPLTGLANRALLRDRLEHALRTRRDGRSVLGLLSIDLDDFKAINDSYGHATGDAVLLEVSRRIEQCLRPADTFARMGGDEFAILVEKVAGPRVIEEIAARVGEALDRPIEIPETAEVIVSASIGLITTRYATADAAAVLRDADIAVYQAKAQGKGRVVAFHPHLHEQAVQRMHVATGLRHALERGELRLHYQPILNGVQHRLVGVEALLRWKDPDRDLVVPPDDFIEIAEATGLIVPIGRWVLDESCRQVSMWCRSYPHMKDLRLSVNVSARQLQQTDLAHDVQGAMSVSGLNPSQLILEVTESTIVKDVKQASAQLAALRLLGVRVSIDDFGTGQSSLAQLQHLPVDELKIDRSFMEKLTDGPAGAAVAESVVKLGRALSLAVVVEGVETAEQVALLEEISSDPMLQGFFFAEPLTPPDLERLIAAEEEARLADRSHSLIAAGRHPRAAATDGAVTPVGPRGSVTARRRARQQRAS